MYAIQPCLERVVALNRHISSLFLFYTILEIYVLGYIFNEKVSIIIAIIIIIDNNNSNNNE